MSRSSVTAATAIFPPASFPTDQVISYRHAGYSLLLGLVLLAAGNPPGHGVEEIILTLGDIEGAGWSLERRQEYFEWAKEVVDKLRGTHHGLERKFDDAYALKP